jgi:aconitate hydratase
MGIVPLQYLKGDTAESLGLTGHEEKFDILGLSDSIASGFANGRQLTVRVTNDKGFIKEFSVHARIDTGNEVLYYRNGGILQYVLRQLVSQKGS